MDRTGRTVKHAAYSHILIKQAVTSQSKEALKETGYTQGPF